MKNKRVIAILLAAAMVTSVAAGCKKDNSEEPLVIYYSGEQQEGASATVTLQSGESGNTPSQTEALAPIIADRTQTEQSVVTPSMETQETETSETAPTETTDAAAAETQPGGEQDGGAADADIPVISGGSHIYDNAGVIADESSVNSAMASFESSTGVSPAIFTINDQLSGDDFRQYARELYSTNFSDQDHVVVVYQLTPAGTWSWTCVFGSNTGTVFDQDTINTFQSDLTNAFSSSNVDTALVTTFNNAQPQT